MRVTSLLLMTVAALAGAVKAQSDMIEDTPFAAFLLSQGHMDAYFLARDAETSKNKSCTTQALIGPDSYDWRGDNQTIFARNAATEWGWACDPKDIHVLDEGHHRSWSSTWRPIDQCASYELPLLVFKKEQLFPSGFVCGTTRVRRFLQSITHQMAAED